MIPSRTGGIDRPDETGIALVVTLLATSVIAALAVGLLLGSTAETMMAANYQRSLEARYAAEAVVAAVVPELSAVADWSAVLSGLQASPFADGVAGGRRRLADGSDLDLDAVVHLAGCRRPTTCDESDLLAASAERPWGPNNPRWRLYAYGPLARLLAPAADSQFYVVLMVGDDPTENDDQPFVDGGAPVSGEDENAGADVLVVRAEAFGPGGAHARVEATLVRSAGVVAIRLGR